ncbi:MAG: SBBP repeat-containing protein [Chloroflexota bacterium]
MSSNFGSHTLHHRPGRGILILWILWALIMVNTSIQPTFADDAIQPRVVFSTYLGGNNVDYGQDIAVDPAGNIYVVGSTDSPDFPAGVALTATSPTLFVSKFDPSGTTLLYSTVLGTGYAGGIAVDADGYAYIVGYGTTFPTVNALQSVSGGGDEDAFIAKLNPAGTALVFSTYLGGSGSDEALGVALDSARNVYVVGVTNSPNFPTHNAYQTSYGGGDWDVFIAKLNPAGNALLYATYYGGSDIDAGLDMVADGDGNVYMTGTTSSSDFPAVNAYQPTLASANPPSLPDNDAFVAKINTAGVPVFSSYLGGSNDSEAGVGIAIDSQRSVYVTGYTDSADFLVQTAAQSTLPNTTNAFVTKFSADGLQLVYLTYLSGNDDSVGTGIAVDAQGRAAITGATLATDFPTVKPIQATRAGAGRTPDFYVAVLNPDGRTLRFSTYLGGSRGESYVDETPRVALDSQGNVLVTGSTLSSDFPVVNAFQNQRGGTIVDPTNPAFDASITKIAFPALSQPAQATTRNYFATHTPTLTWTPITWATHYHVQVSKNKLFTGILDFEGQTGANVLSITTTPQDDGLHYWRVQAQKADGSWGGWSPAESFTVDAN